MSGQDIEDRLRSHAKAFDSLLNLIPAKLYFNQDNSDQWKKRKQTKEESQAAKRAKLDPDQAVTVKEVEEERTRQRTEREEKRRKLNEDGVAYETKSQMKARKKEEKRRERRDKKQLDPKPQASEKNTLTEEDNHVSEETTVPTSKKQKIETPKNAAKAVESPVKEQHHPAKRKEVKQNGVKPNGVQIRVNGTQNTGKATIQKPAPKPTPKPATDKQSGEDEDEDSDEEEEEEVVDDEDQVADEMPDVSDSEEDEEAADDDSGDEQGDSIRRIKGLASTMDENTSASPSPAPSNTTDTSTAQKSLAEKLKNSNDPAVQQQLKERLAKRIEELRQARKADGGQAPRTRTELMDQRRKRDELRKERKKQMRLQAKVEAAKSQEDPEPADASKPHAKSNGVSTAPANYSFGQVNFDDGEGLSANLDSLRSAKKKRGPTDVLGALKQVEAKKARLANMSDDKRADIQEKDRWSKALKMASGEKLQDDESLLKKSLKRQEKAKKKSEREWNERNANVVKAKVMRQKKRDANIAARKEQKKAGKSGKKAPRKAPSKKSKGRAGFEGTGFGGAGKKKR